LYSIPLPPANAPLRQAEIPAGIAVSPDGKRLYVAGNLSNHLIELEAATGKVLQLWDVGVAPFDVVLAGRKIYVSNWGGRRPDADSATGPAGDGMRVRVDARSIANEGSVSVIEKFSPACTRARWRLSPDGRWLVVANAGSDTLSVIDTRTDKIVGDDLRAAESGDLFGAQPDALAFDKSGQNVVCRQRHAKRRRRFSIQARRLQIARLIPVGWFPGGDCV
jgi:DNA-binding beta-propeller fold protein YncE